VPTYTVLTIAKGSQIIRKRGGHTMSEQWLKLTRIWQGLERVVAWRSDLVQRYRHAR